MMTLTKPQDQAGAQVMKYNPPSSYSGRATRWHSQIKLILVLCMATTLWFAVSGCVVNPQRASDERAKQHLERAEELLAQGLTEDALSAFEAALQENPDLTEASLGVANIYEEQGDLESAKESYKQATESDPTSYTAHYKLGLMQQLLGEVRNAIRTYLKAVAIDPQQFEVNRDLAAAYLQLGRPGDALRYAERAVKLEPSSQQAWSNLAATYSLMGRYDDAVNTYRQAAELGDLADPVLLGLADAHIKLGNYRRAINTLESLIRRSESATAYERKGFAQYKLRRFEESLRSFEKALAINPKDTAALNGVGVAQMTLYIEGGRVSASKRDAAIQAWRESVRIRPDQPRIVDLLSRYRRL